MEHADDFFHNVEVILGDVHPDVESGSESRSELFAGDRGEVRVRFDQDLQGSVSVRVSECISGYSVLMRGEIGLWNRGNGVRNRDGGGFRRERTCSCCSVHPGGSDTLVRKLLYHSIDMAGRSSRE